LKKNVCSIIDTDRFFTATDKNVTKKSEKRSLFGCKRKCKCKNSIIVSSFGSKIEKYQTKLTLENRFK